MKKWLKNQKGLTLVELLAVIVILGIIAAIAVPAIGNIIENSRKDAQIANAEAMYDAARLAQAGEDLAGAQVFDLLDEDNAINEYIDPAFAESDPHSEKYEVAKVEITSNNQYFITLHGSGGEDFKYFDGTNITSIRNEGRDGFADDFIFNPREEIPTSE